MLEARLRDGSTVNLDPDCYAMRCMIKQRDEQNWSDDFLELLANFSENWVFRTLDGAAIPKGQIVLVWGVLPRRVGNVSHHGAAV